MAYAKIDMDNAMQRIASFKADDYLLVDIRDQDSFERGHIPNSRHLDQSGISEFINDADRQLPLFVCCYHGNMSQGAAAYFSEQGFEETYSMNGGYEAWKMLNNSGDV